MKKIIHLLLLGFAARASFAQQKDLTKIADSIVAEGKTLYKSEWASWYGEDIFLAQCPNKKALLGGYLSYDDGKGLTNILLSKGNDPLVLGSVSFGYDFDKTHYQLDSTSRTLKPQEAELFKIRAVAVEKLSADTSFKRYKHANLNPIPIINNGIKRVYVLTGPDINGVVLFGNDYLLTFNNNNEIVSTRRLHKNLIAINTSKVVSNDSSKTVLATMHTHLAQTGEFITATDICTLMLYEKFTTWNQHMVMGPNYVSIWDCKADQINILSLEEWKKTNSLKKALESTKKP